MDKKILMSDNIKNILLVTFLLFLGIVTVLAARAVMNMQTEGILVGILFGPLLAYAILFSGRLRRVAFGSLILTLGDVAQEMVSPYSGEIKIGPDLRALQKVGEKGITALEAMLAEYDLSEAHPIVMIIQLGKENYPRDETLGFIEKLSRYRSFKFVVISNRADKVEGYMASWAARQLLSDPIRGDKFLSIINCDGNLVELFQNRHVIRDPIGETETNATALQQMTNLDLDALVVVDNDGHLKGVVERDEIIVRMLLALLKK